MRKTTLKLHQGKFQNMNFAQCSVCLNTIVLPCWIMRTEFDLPSECPDCHGDKSWLLAKEGKKI